MSEENTPGDKPKHVYVLDDEVQVLEVIEMQLAAAGYDVTTFSRPSDFLSRLDNLEPGVLISDQRMPEIEGLSVQEELRKWSHKFQMILLSGYPETRVAVQAMQKGAVTVLDKPYDRQQLLESIEDAFAALDRAIQDDTGLPPLLSNDELYVDRLSSRERQVVDLVYEGETNKSIGIRLGISIKTVEKHRGKAMKKMEVKSLAELIRLMDREQRR